MARFQKDHRQLLTQVPTAGENFKVLEFNGIASEPAQICDPAYSIRHACRDIFQHWKIIYQISKVQRQKEYFRYLRSLRNCCSKILL